MPCTDGGPSPEQEREERAIPAWLCAIATVLEERHTLDDVLDSVDWKECGATRRQFERWWKRHKWEDAERRRQEAEDIKTERLRKQAIAKMTPAQRRAFNV